MPGMKRPGYIEGGVVIFVWKGYGWLFLLVVMVSAGLLWTIQGLVPAATRNPDLIEAAGISGLSAIATLLLAGWLERRDRARDETLDAKSAQGQHTLYWISLVNWGYLAAFFGSVLLVVSCLPGVQL